MSREKQSFDYRKYGRIGWFSALESAKERNDFKGAAIAQSELKKLGVTVKYKNRAANKNKVLERPQIIW